MVHHPWPAAPDVIWHIYSHLYCSSRDGGRDLLSSGEAAPTMGQVPCEFQADRLIFIFQPATPDVIWHIYSGQCCFKGVEGMDLPSSGDVALTMGQVPCEFQADCKTFIFQPAAPDVIWHIYSGQCCFKGVEGMDLPSSMEVFLDLGKIHWKSGEDYSKHWGSYPWGVCQGPRPQKSESGRMELRNVGRSARNLQGTCPMVRVTSPEDSRSIPNTPLKQHCPE